MMEFVKCMQTRISSPLRVDEDEISDAIPQLCITVQIVLPPQATGSSFYPSANFVVIYTAMSPHPHMNQLSLERKGIHTSACACMEGWIKYSLFILHLLLAESLGSGNSNLLAGDLESVWALSRSYTQCAPVSASQCAPVSPGERMPLSTAKRGRMNEAGVGSGSLLRSGLRCHQQELPSYF